MIFTGLMSLLGYCRKHKNKCELYLSDCEVSAPGAKFSLLCKVLQEFCNIKPAWWVQHHLLEPTVMFYVTLMRAVCWINVLNQPHGVISVERI